jgi:hypothetical protein
VKTSELELDEAALEERPYEESGEFNVLQADQPRFLSTSEKR